MDYEDNIKLATNRRLAKAIREISAKHEASWVPRPLPGYGAYAKSESQCIDEAVGEDPIAIILRCLFNAGYSDMYDFCDQVLGEAHDIPGMKYDENDIET